MTNQPTSSCRSTLHYYGQATLCRSSFVLGPHSKNPPRSTLGQTQGTSSTRATWDSDLGPYHSAVTISVSVSINKDKIEWESRFDGKWVLTTNTNLLADQVALKYKELWQVEQVFRDVKSVLETRPVYHQKDENIRGHVFCSFLALVLRKELDKRLEEAGRNFEWADIKQDLKALQEVEIQDGGKSLALRTQCLGTCGKVFKAVGVAVPPAIREL